MDARATTQQKSVVGKYFESKLQKQRNKLVRSTECIGKVLHRQDELRKETLAAAGERSGSVMGGGLAAPQALQSAIARTAATTTSASCALELDDASKEKTEKLKPQQKNAEKADKGEKGLKPQKDGKFAEKLRRSFRRSEHKSLEIKRSDKFEPQDNKYAGGGLRGGPLLHKNSQSIFSLHNLPGLGGGGGGGHINPALLLDSPDEATPPEYAYQHLSSVATTNSSTSLESNFEFGEANSSQSSISYWAWQQSNSSMGGEVSTASSGGVQAAATAGPVAAKDNRETEHEQQKQKQKLVAQCSSKSDIPVGGAAHAPASRSCSITSDSSSAKLTRLQNFLFKSSNESSKSYQGHSNEGFTASSHNSSSGEWENLGNPPPSSSTSTAPPDFYVGSFPEESIDFSTQPDAEDTGGTYYQYTLTSPNNPFLPEITARTYTSSHEGEQQRFGGEEEAGHLRGTHSAQLPTPAYSRAGSQESTHSESGVSGHSHSHAHVATPVHSNASSASSTPGRQKRKLFSLNSPTRHLQHQSAQQHQQQQKTPSFIASTAETATKSTSASGGSSFVRSLNPFLPTVASVSALAAMATASSAPPSASSHKRAPLKQSAITSPTWAGTAGGQAAVPPDLNAKREEFLRATMKICLVVSPPTSKLQLKSKSLTHLDGLDSMITCPHAVNDTPATTAAGKASNSATTPTTQMQSITLKPHTTTTTTTTTSTHRLTPVPPTIYTQAPNQCALKTTPITAATATTTTTSSCTNKICCLGEHVGLSGANEASTPNPPAQHMLSPAVLSIGGAGAPGTTSLLGVTPGGQKKKSSFMQRKKPLLTRSEVSSSEYFSVSFCTDQGVQDEEFIPAIKGVTLLNALSQALKRRNLSFSQITITDNNAASSYLEAGYPAVINSLDENTDVENLAGRHLIITERDGSRKMLQKAASFGSRARPPRLPSSASTEETTETTATGKQQTKQRWTGLFGLKNPQQNQLCELLNSYAKSGVPQRTAALSFDYPALDAALYYLDNMHSSWRDFVEGDNMSDSEIKIQTAIWELVTTEVCYIHALQTVTNLFLACLEAVQEERLLTEVDQLRLFSNVRDICEANLKFWTLYLYPMVAHSVAAKEPMRIAFFQQGFSSFATTFAPYKKYCAEQSTCQFYCKELSGNNALFTSYLAWCESQKMCNRLRLADILVRPMQRLTKYSLLLAAIKKHMSDADEIDAIDAMIHTVENFVCSVNNHLTTRQENERLKGVMARLESYDVVDSSNELLDKMIKQYSQMFDLCSPMKGCATHHVRHLFMEGDHKYKDSLGKADVHCFLLTDMLLVCKTIARKGLGALKVIRQPYLTDRLVVHHINNILNCVYLNEFNVAISAFTLQSSEAKNWYESLKRAKTIYTKLKQGASNWDSFRFGGSGASGATADSLGVRKSPMNSSIGSHVSSANNSHSGSVEWNDSRNISVDFEKTNSLSSDEGSSLLGGHVYPPKGKNSTTNPHKLKINTSSANTLSVQPLNSLGQSLPNLNLHHSHTNLYHTYSNNTLLVPGTSSHHSGNTLLSPSHRGISYPPPSPTRVPLRRGMAFSNSIKNPPLVKTRNITSQNSINWHQTPATPTPPSPQSQNNSPNANATAAAAPKTPPTNAEVNAGATTAAPHPTTAVAPAPAPVSGSVDPSVPVQEPLYVGQCQSVPTTSTETDV